MTGAEYANLVASYISRRFASRALKVYREIKVQDDHRKRPLRRHLLRERRRTEGIRDRVQVSGQSGHGGRTIPYALEDVRALPMAGCIAYAGSGFSSGVLHMLAASPHAAYCLPLNDQSAMTSDTKELDHVLAVHFGWWDVLVGQRRPIASERLI